MGLAHGHDRNRLRAYIVDYAFASQGAWRWMFGVGLVPGVILAVAMLSMPETPARVPLERLRCALRTTRNTPTSPVAGLLVRGVAEAPCTCE
jgi:MFS family permease